MLVTLLTFLLILSVLVLIHEAGHFFVAKWLGIKVEEFGYGFPPKVWGKKFGETLYTINLLPIGGFVKLYGEDDAGGGKVSLPTKNKKLITNTKDEGRAFYARPVWQRAAVVLAGVIMNTVLAVLIYYVYMGISGFKAELPLLGDHHFFAVNQKNVAVIIISDVVKDSPAAKAGIPPYARVIALNGIKINEIDTFLKIVTENKGKQMSITWQDTKTQVTKTVMLTPRVNVPKNQGALGVSFFPVETAVLTYDTPAQKIFSGVIHPLNLMAYNYDVMKQLISVSIKNKTAEPVSQGFSGPVGIYSVVGTIVQIPDMKEKVLQILNLAGILSMSLAFFNVLPIPALDGGRLFFILIEGIFRKKVSVRVETMAHNIGMIVLLGLILIVTFKDVFQLFR